MPAAMPLIEEETAGLAAERIILEAIALEWSAWTIWRSHDEVGDPHWWCATWTYPSGDEFAAGGITLIASGAVRLIAQLNDVDDPELVEAQYVGMIW